MPDWGEIIGGIGSFLEGASYAAIIEDWIKRDFNDGLNSIEAYVKSVSTGMIDNMDSALLLRIHMTIDPDNKDILVKYYAFFKMMELVKFEAFRGFPSNPLG